MNTLLFASPTTNLMFAPAWAFDQDTPGLDDARGIDRTPISNTSFAWRPVAVSISPRVARIDEVDETLSPVKVNPNRTQRSVAAIPLGNLDDAIDPCSVDEPEYEYDHDQRVGPHDQLIMMDLPPEQRETLILRSRLSLKATLVMADACKITLDLADWIEAVR